MLTPDQMARLPKYAQERIYDLERQVSDLAHDRAERARLMANPETTPIKIVGHSTPDIGLPEDCTIRFTIGNDREYIEFHLVKSNEGGGGRIRAVSEVCARAGIGPIKIEPSASNTIFLSEGER